MNSNNLTKPQLRKQIKLIVSNLTDTDKKLASQQIIEKIAQCIISHPNIKTIASYAATSREVNLDSLHTTLPNIKICYPKSGMDGQMKFYTVSDLTEMNVGTYGIREPRESLHSEVVPAAIDLILCPAYAYTISGERLGKGGGYYDRYLPKMKPDTLTLGIVFPCQIIATVPTETHDFLVDRVL